MKTLTTTVKETTEKQVSIQIEFPAYLIVNKEVFRIEDHNGGVAFPYLAIRIGKIHATPYVDATILSESEVARMAQSGEKVTEDYFNSQLDKAFAAIKEFVGKGVTV